jgi:hypothetical protein
MSRVGRLSGFFASYAVEPITKSAGNIGTDTYTLLRKEAPEMDGFAPLLIGLAGALGFCALGIAPVVLDTFSSPPFAPHAHTRQAATRRSIACIITNARPTKGV